MADKTLVLKNMYGESLPIKLTDLGDGTYAVASSATATFTGDVTVSNEVEIKNDAGSPIPTAAADGGVVSLGAKADTAATADTGTFSLIAIAKRIVAKLTGIGTQLPAALGSTTAANSLPVVLSSDGPAVTAIGSLTETAPATDTASSGLNGRLQRVAQRLTSVIALLPAALGGTTAAASLPVVLSSDGPFATQTGSITETAPATDTASSGLNGRLQRIAQRVTSVIALLPAALGQGTMAQSLRVAIASDQASFPVVGVGYSNQLSLTRTNDTNAYAGGDVIGTGTGAAGAALTFATMGAAAGHVIITDVDLLVAVAAVPSGMTSFRLHLYNVTPPSALGDNAAWDLPSGDRASYLGYIDLGTPVDVGSSLFVQTSGVNKKVLLGASSSLFGYLVTNGGYTPTAQTVKLIRLNAISC